MSTKSFDDISFDEFDEINNPRNEPVGFESVVGRALSRRGVLALAGAGVAAGVLAGASRKVNAESRMAFKPVAANSNDTVTVPEGYDWQVVARWGDPLWSGAEEFDPVSCGTGESQEKAMGDNNDGMSFFSRGDHQFLVVNNEYVNRKIIYANRDSKRPENEDDVRKGKAGHGVTVMEVNQTGDGWKVIKDAPLNRRITADTPMQITGPAAGHDLLKTAADPTGKRSLGTWNNCANGRTPWGTYLTCEENFNGYFSSSDPSLEISQEMKRYGIGKKGWKYGWGKYDERFDLAKTPNECNRAGYVVEIDPFDPNSTPKKRTALGRFKHENAEVVVARNGHVVVYMGDDERGEFIYRFISEGKLSQGGDNADLLEKGKLYVARFEDDQSGRWIELTPQATGMASAAEIAIHTRIAASKVGATTMDRPEWVAAHPTRSEVYCCLTHNKNRGRKANKGGDDMPVGGPNPRANNKYGQIVRWFPADDDHTAETFSWNLFVIAGNPEVHTDARKGSGNVTRENMFNSPDGLVFDDNGLLWIQTDGTYSNTGDFAGMGNNQMLVADPDSGEIRRFLVGPKECEITGHTWSTDRRTMFVGIQHPGEKGNGNSHFPGGGTSVPRSSIVAITRKDGGRV